MHQETIDIRLKAEDAKKAVRKTVKYLHDKLNLGDLGNIEEQMSGFESSSDLSQSLNKSRSGSSSCKSDSSFNINEQYESERSLKKNRYQQKTQ